MSPYGTTAETSQTTMPPRVPPLQTRRDSGLAANSGVLGSVARFWQRTYAPDYVGLLFLSIAYFAVCVCEWNTAPVTTAANEYGSLASYIRKPLSSHVCNR